MRSLKDLIYIISCFCLFLIPVSVEATVPEAINMTISPSGTYVPIVTLTGGYTFSDSDGDMQDIAGTFIGWYQATDAAGTGASLIASNSITFSVTTAYRGRYIAFGVIPRDMAGETGALTFSSWELVNALPIGSDDNYTNLSIEGGVLSRTPAQGVLPNDNSGGDGQSIQAFKLTDPAHGTVSLSSDGSFVYTHNGDEFYTDDFTYQVYDGFEYSSSTTVHIQVIPDNDAPIFTSVPEETATEGLGYIYNIATSDAENNGRTITSVGTLPSWLSLYNLINGTGLLTGTPGNGDVGTHNITLRVSDGSDYTDQIFPIVVSNINDNPVLSNIEGSILQYEEGETGKNITSTIQVTDADNTTLTSATITIISGLVPDEDRLSFDASPPLSTSYTQSTGVFSITGEATINAYRTALRNIEYYNINDIDPVEGDRVVRFEVTDGVGTSNTLSRTIRVSAVNDPPDVTEDFYYDIPEGGTLSTTPLTGVLRNDDDLDGPSAMTAHLVDDVEHGTLTLLPTGAFTYVHDNSNFLSDLFTYYAYDGEDQSVIVNANIILTPVNDPPVIGGVSTDTLTYTEDDAPTIITPTIQLTDEDNTSIASATVEFDEGYVMGEDSLVFSPVGGLTIVFDTLTGVLTATGSASPSVYQNNLLRNIRYWNTNTEDPNPGYRRVTFTASDGEDTSDPVSKVIEVLPWNDPPVASDATLLGANFYVDEVLTVDYNYSDPDGDPEGNTQFRWYMASDGLGTGSAPITGWRTVDTLTPTFANGGNYLSATVRPYDNNNLVGTTDATDWEYIDAAPEFIDFEIRNLSHPGAFAPGETVRAEFTYDDFEGDAEGTHEFQWYRSYLGTWPTAESLDGEDGQSLLIDVGEEGYRIAVRGTPRALDGSDPGDVYESDWYLVSALPSATMSVEPENDSLCNDGSTTIINVSLSGNNPPWTFRYTVDGGTDTTDVFVSAIQSNFELEVAEAGTYELVGVSDSEVPIGVFSGEAVIGYYPNPTAIMTRSEFTICDNDDAEYEIPINLTGKAPWSLSYQYDEDTDSTTIYNIDTAYYGIEIQLADIGNYNLLHVWDANCMSSGTGSTDVLVKDSPLAFMVGDTSVCPDDVATLNVELEGTGPWTFTYTRNSLDEVDVVVPQTGSTYTYELEVTDPGIYELVGVTDTEDDGCASGAITVDQYDIPTATIGGNEQTCEGTEFDFNVVLEGESPWSIQYQYNTETPVTINNIGTNPYPLTVSEPGNYTIREVQDAHCPGVGSGVATLVVDPLPEVSILGMETKYSIQTTLVPINVNPDGGNFLASDFPYAMLQTEGQWNFMPSVALSQGGSPFWIRYSYPDPVTGCVGMAEHKVFILTDAAEIYIDNDKDVYCFNDEPLEIEGVNIRDNTGTFSITNNVGLVNTGDNKALVYPNEILEGQKTITYTVEIDNEIEIAQKTLSFNHVKGDFTWDNECLGDDTQITFTDVSTSTYEDFGWDWSFNFPGDTIKADTSFATIRINDLSRYNFELIVSSSFNDDVCYDTVRKEFSLKPTFDVHNLPYDESFSLDTAYWSSFSIDGSQNSWTYGTPTGSIWEELAPSTKAWYTDIADRSATENSYIISPCYDFTNTQRPMIKFDIWKGFVQNLDGAVLQYTINNGTKWETVGSYPEDGIEWYNYPLITGTPAGQNFGWTSLTADEGWKNARHKLDIDELKSNSPVRFRIAYGQSGIAPNNNGLAIDNIWIGERKKKALFEHFTNTSDAASAMLNPDLNALFNAKENSTDIIDIQYHLGEPYFGPDTFHILSPQYANSRKIYYGVQNIPYGVMDGGREADVDFLFDFRTENLEQNQLTLAALEDNKFDIKLQSIPGNNSMDIQVEIFATEHIPQKELTLHMVIVENVVKGVVGENGETEFESVFKTMLPDAIGTTINRSWDINDGGEYFSFHYDFENVFSDTSLRVIAFIQDVATKEIYQAEKINPFLIPGLNPLKMKDSKFTIFPNPASRTAYLRYEEMSYGALRLEIFDINGRLVLQEEIYTLEGDIEIPIDDFEAGLYFVKVFTDDQIIGTEKLLKLGNKD